MMIITLLPILLVTFLLVSFGVLAGLFGVDSRDGRDWQPRSDWDF